MKRLKSVILTMALLGASCLTLAAPQPGTKPDCNNNMVITELQPLDFGAFVAELAGSVTIEASAAGTRLTSGVTPLASDIGQAGIFEVSVTTLGDCSGYQLFITLPTSFQLSAAGQTITVSNLITSPVSGIAALGPGNTPLLIYVGGTASVAAGQVGGIYTGSYTFDAVFR